MEVEICSFRKQTRDSALTYCLSTNPSLLWLCRSWRYPVICPHIKMHWASQPAAACFELFIILRPPTPFLFLTPIFPCFSSQQLFSLFRLWASRRMHPRPSKREWSRRAKCHWGTRGEKDWNGIRRMNNYCDNSLLWIAPDRPDISSAWTGSCQGHGNTRAREWSVRQNIHGAKGRRLRSSSERPWESFM